MISVDLIDNIRDLEAVGADWNDTVERAGVPHPFLRHEWTRTWWECFGGDSRLNVLVVRADGRIIAIAPLMLEKARMYRVPIRRLRLMYNDHSPSADFIVAERPADAYAAIWEALAADRGRWDVLQLSGLLAGSPTREALSSLAARAGCRCGVWEGERSPFLTLTGSWDGFLAGTSPKLRQNVRNRLTRAALFGEPRLEVTQDAAACSDVLRLEASGWKREAGTAISSDPMVATFYQRLAERANEGGWLRLMFLTVGGRRIAASYSACYRNRLFFVKTGYDPDYAKCAPFKLLTWFALQDAFRTGLNEVDFLGDAEPWKLEWTRTTRPHDWLFIFSGTPRAQVLHPLKFHVLPALKAMRDRHLARATN